MKRKESLDVFVEVQGILGEVEGDGMVWEVLGEVAVAAVVAPKDEVRARGRLVTWRPGQSRVLAQVFLSQE